MRIVLPLLLCCVTGLVQAASNFTFSNAPGPHGVGLKVVQQYDYSRGYRGAFDAITGKAVSGEKARPVQTLVWYPAQKSGKAVTFNDYLRTAATEEKFDLGEADIAQATARTVRAQYGDADAARVREEGQRPMWAVRDAKAVQGKFPVVIYAPSFSAAAAENPDLCEYLASLGYVVIASASMGARSRAMTKDLDGIEAGAADIAFLIGYAHTLPQADTARLAVAGYSWGGIANVFAAARDSRIKALVNLDGSVRYFPELVSASKYVVPARVALPMLYLAQRPQSIEDLARRGKQPASFLNDMKYSDLYKVTLHPMEHFAFSASYLRYAPAARFTDYSRAEVNAAHGWAVRYVHQFLDAYLKGDAAGRDFLNKPATDNGSPAHMLTLDVQRAQGLPPTQETLAVELARRGFEHAHDAYALLRQQAGTFELPEGDVIGWGYRLLLSGETGPAVEIFKLATILYPNSGNAFDSLAEAYEQSRDTGLAEKNYRRSLELDPKNSNAVARLKVLASAATGAARQ